MILGIFVDKAIMLAAFIITTICIVGYLFAPQKYVVTPDRIIVWRFGPKVIILASSIEKVDFIELSNMIRTCGTGGFFGSYGWFYSSQLGNFRAYISRTDKLVVLRLKGANPVVLSPDDDYGFFQAVNDIVGKE